MVPISLFANIQLYFAITARTTDVFCIREMLIEKRYAFKNDAFCNLSLNFCYALGTYMSIKSIN